MVHKKTFQLLFLCLTTLFLSSGALADDIDRASQDIFSSIMSPYCPGLLLSDCPSSKATDLKKLIRSQLEEGRSSTDVLTELERRYGDSIKAMPSFGGVGILLWGAIPLFIFIGLFIWLRVVFKKRLN